MRSYLAAQFVLYLSIGSFQHASATDDNADLSRMKRQLIDIYDLANTTYHLSKNYNGNHTASQRNFPTLKAYMIDIFQPAEQFRRRLVLEENGEYDGTTSFKSWAWTEVRELLRRASDANNFIKAGPLW